MVQIRRTLITAVSLAALAGAGALIVYDRLDIVAANEVNTRIAANQARAQSALPEEVFAAGVALARAGKVGPALAQYNRVENDDSAPDWLRRAARFNSGNLYLRDAVEAADAGDTAAATPNFELAKAAYRHVLRADPGHMAARYNLERALRRSPEAEQAEELEVEQPPEAEQAITTMQIESQGLP
ncbi:MAG: MxaK protein [Rhodocyclaceae bacterium]|nr:MxaK protein [Rhodocyclaceae bacterium]